MWRMIRLFVELTVVLKCLEPFANSIGFFDAIGIFQNLQELQQIGVITAFAISASIVKEGLESLLSMLP